MALKYQLESLEGLDDGVAQLYAKDPEKEGHFILDVTGVASKSKVDEFRAKNIDLLKEMDKYKGVDVEKYAELQQQQQALEDQELIKSGDVDKVIARRVESLNTEHEGVVAGLNSQISTQKRRLESLLIDSAVRDASTESGVLAAATNDVLLRAKSVFSIDEAGRVVAMNDKKEKLFGKDGVTPLAVGEWVKSLKKDATHLFVQSTGGGANSSNMQGVMDVANMSAMQKITAGLN